MTYPTPSARTATSLPRSTVVYPPGLSEPVIIPRQLTSPVPPPVEEWPAEAFDRLMDAVREVPAGRVRRALWLAKQHVRAAVGR